jgi:hypothetical protein
MARLKGSQNKRSLKLQFGAELRDNKALHRADSPDGNGFTISLVPFVNLMLAKLAERPPLTREPALTQCQADAKAAELLRHLGEPRNAPAQRGLGEKEDESTTASRIRPWAFVDEHVSRVMGTATSPEEKLLVNVDPWPSSTSGLSCSMAS